jgi:hypothetical protein
MFFSKKKELQKLNTALALSFSQVKGDIEALRNSDAVSQQSIGNLYAWVSYLGRQNQLLQRQNQQLLEEVQGIKKSLQTVPASRDEIKAIIDYYYAFEDTIKKVRDMDSTLSHLTEKFTRFSSIKEFDIASQLQYLAEIKELKSRLEKLETQPQHHPQKQSVREKIIKKITQKSRDYVRSLILSYIQKYERISALKLREMVVEEQGLASKSAFYRLLEEVEKLEEIEVIRDGKEKYYLHKVIRHH